MSNGNLSRRDFAENTVRHPDASIVDLPPQFHAAPPHSSKNRQEKTLNRKAAETAKTTQRGEDP